MLSIIGFYYINTFQSSSIHRKILAKCGSTHSGQYTAISRMVYFPKPKLEPEKPVFG